MNLYQRLWLDHHYPPTPDNAFTRAVLYIGMACAAFAWACFGLAMLLIIGAGFAGLLGWGSS